MSIPRGLSAEEKAAWAKLAASVTPLEGRKRPDPPRVGEGDRAKQSGGDAPLGTATPAKVHWSRGPQVPVHQPAVGTAPQMGEGKAGLDSHWDRKFKAGMIQPDYTLDLHGHTLDTAYDRLMAGLDQARAMDARVVLLIAGRSRPVDPADRQNRRGAIRAKLLDWLAASRHSDAISAVRKAHIRHGGEGALYLVLKRGR